MTASNDVFVWTIPEVRDERTSGRCLAPNDPSVAEDGTISEGGCEGDREVYCTGREGCLGGLDHRLLDWWPMLSHEREEICCPTYMGVTADVDLHGSDAMTTEGRVGWHTETFASDKIQIITLRVLAN